MVEQLTDNIKQELETSLVQIGSDKDQKTQMGKPFPLVLSPRDGQQANFVQLQEYFLTHNKQILKAASDYGAVMFSGFEIKTGEEWASVMYKSGIKEMPYVGGAAVRKLIVGNESRMNNPQVLTTNESPPSEPIPFHHELAQTPDTPDHICFCCSINDAEGGSTPLIRSDMVWNYIMEKAPEAAKKFEDLGVKYVKIAPEEDDPSSALGRSWKSMYGVQTKEAAEEAAKKQGTTLEWLEGGDCRIISQTLPAVKVSSNGNKVFFNQVIAAYTGWVDKRNEIKKAVRFGDDSPMPDDVLMDLAAYMDREKSAYRWTPGKFVIVDNTVAYHSRQPFFGRRRVFASIGKGTKPVTDTQTHLVLNSGDKMPMLGLGLWKMGKDVCPQAIENAVDAGYRMFDSACDYGNEKETGAGLKKVIDSGKVKREDLFVVSKLWNTFHHPDHVKEACQKSLSDLGLEYLDLYLIHFPIAQKYVSPDTRYPPEWIHDPKDANPRMEFDMETTYDQTWKAMEQLVSEGLVRNIGFCNIGTLQISQVLRYCKVKPAVLQVEMHPLNTQQKLLRYAREAGIQTMAFSNMGSLSYVELGMASNDDSILTKPVVQDLAKKHNKTAAQVVLRWGVQRGTAVIPKSSNAGRLAENAALFDFTLSNEEMASLDGLNQNRRFNDPGVFAEGAFNTFCPIYD